MLLTPARNHGTHREHPRYAAALLVAAAILVPAAPAAAQDGVPSNNGGATQYIPPRPDPGGDKPSNPASPSRPDRLPASTRAALPAGTEGDLLERFATSQGYGAPADEPRAGGRGGAGGRHDAATSGRTRIREEGGTAASAVTSAVSDPSVAVLAIALAALTLGALALGRARRRRS